MKTKFKQRALLLFALIINAGFVYSQSSKTSIGLTGGVAQEGFGGKASFNYYKNESGFFQLSALTTFSKDKVNESIEIPYDIYSLNIGYYTRFLRTKKDNLTVFVGGGLSAGYESVNNKNQNLVDGSLLVSESAFLYGAFIGLDVDVYLSDNLSFIIQSDLFYHLGSDLGNLHAYSGVGLRYFIN